MADESFVKLFRSICESTVWQEPNPTRIVWITMLALSDSQGCVYASIPGLASRARVEISECEAALDSFLSPDPYSRTAAQDGRRIEIIPGGWHLVNWDYYHNLMSAEARREYMRLYMRRYRSKGKGPVNNVNDKLAKLAQEEQEEEQEQSVSKPKKVSQVGRADRFGEFWGAYPKKVKKKQALAKWKARKLDALADQIIADVQNRLRNDGRWLEGFAPDPTTYLNGDRWEDEISAPKNGNGGAATRPKRAADLSEPELAAAAKRLGIPLDQDFRSLCHAIDARQGA